MQWLFIDETRRPCGMALIFLKVDTQIKTQNTSIYQTIGEIFSISKIQMSDTPVPT